MKLLLLLALIFVPACGGLLQNGPPPARVQLNPSLPGKAPAVPGKQLVIALPQAEQDVDSDGISLLFHGREVRYLSGYRWISPAPRIIQRAFLDALQATGALAGVADDMAGIAADARLLCDIRQFCLRWDEGAAPPTAWFAATLRLVDTGSGRLLGSRALDVSVPAASGDTPALIRAMETALEQVLSEATDWTLERLRGKYRAVSL
ncbi:MAG: ABC-type transport auxiliary lipoprotein family protein [Desulfovibrio sp.]|jgi:cholesterol transport system auxiliary component|nr:ABC-type transport auxiliary lipoprotein family protein [Desulfovibrio sp.]